MPGKLRGIRAVQAIRAFERAGRVRPGGKGDHTNLVMPSGLIVTIAVKGEVKVGLFRSAISKAGLTEEEFLGLL